jgi:hypothetical protein
MSGSSPAGRRGTARPKAVGEGLIVRPVGAETLVYDTHRHRMHCLEPLIARIWRCCSGRRTAAQVAAAASDARTVVDVGMVELALLRLRRARLVEPEAPSAAPGLGRRELLGRTAGLGGLALLTLGAPTVLQAATCTTLAECRALGNSNCTSLPCCAGAGVPSGSTCNKRGNGKDCNCS